MKKCKGSKMRIQKLIADAYEQVHRVWHNLGYLYKFLVFITPFLTIAFYFAFVFDYLPSDAAGKYGGLVHLLQAYRLAGESFQQSGHPACGAGKNEPEGK